MKPEDDRATPITNEIEASTPDEERTLSKNETIELLQQSIKQLEQVVDRLNVEETSELPEPSSIRNLVMTAEALKTNMIAAQPETAQSEPEPEVQVTQSPVTPPQPPTTSTKTPPVQIAPKRRFQTVLPIVVAFVIAIALGTWLWLSRPLPEFLARTVEPGTEIPPKVTAPAIEQPVAENPQETVADTPETIEVPLELTSPGKSKNLTIKPVPIQVKLTPEQKLIAAVKDKIAAISKEYPQELVSSVATNFLNSSLSVTIGDRWYELDAEGQNRLARDLLKRSQELNFKKLSLQDTSQNLIARNPVVGNEMVIFLRETTE
jgi:hypothetical protein